MAEDSLLPDLNVGERIVIVALTFIPGLQSVPVLGRLLRVIAPSGGNEFQAIEDLQRQADRLRTERQTRIERNARYVLKASDAMRCVEDNLMSGGVLLALGKGILNAVLGDPRGNAADLLCDAIFTCIESKTLKQTGRRQKKTGTWYGRPAKGHGHGRSADV